MTIFFQETPQGALYLLACSHLEISCKVQDSGFSWEAGIAGPHFCSTAMTGLSSDAHHYHKTLGIFVSQHPAIGHWGMFSLAEAVAASQIFSPKMPIKVEHRKSLILRGGAFTFDREKGCCGNSFLTNPTHHPWATRGLLISPKGCTSVFLSKVYWESSRGCFSHVPKC